MKRSVSPLTGQSSESQPKKKRLISMFSALKDVFSKSNSNTHETQVSKTNPLDEGAPDNEDLPSTFVSRKRRMSINDTIKRSSLTIPRSSVSGPSGKGMLEALYNSVKSKEEINHVDGEFTRLGSNPEEQLAKELSPSVHVPKTHALPKLLQGESFLGGMNVNPEQNQQPLILEQDYDSFYEDDPGNFVRPPFINLDPRERYHMLQMKKSIEASEFLQSRLKYMVDPDETTSIHRPSNKVDSATQTHTKEYLHKSLNFNALKTKLALQNRRQRKTKKGLGAFSGEFYYEPSEANAPTNSDSKFSGVLGSVNKPKFAEKAEKKEDRLFPDADARQIPLKRRGSVSQRPGLEDALRFGKTQESLDEDYIQKTTESSNLIKIKNQPPENKSISIGPSAAFKFDIQKDKINSILDVKKAEVDLGDSKNGESNTNGTFTSSASTIFGSQTKEDNKITREETPRETEAIKPGMFGSSKPFSFGGKPESLVSSSTKTAENPIPSLSFGSNNQDKQRDLLGDKTSSTDVKKSSESKTPTFSFGASSSKGESQAPAFSFGSTEKSEKAESPAFSFGGKKGNTVENPSISFSGGAAESGSKPPAFSFGGTEKQSETKLPSFSFGSEKKPAGDKTPTFSFGSEKKPTESEAPLFSFGKVETGKEEKGSKISVKDGSVGSAQISSTPETVFGKSVTGSNSGNDKFSFGSAAKPIDISTSKDETEEPQAKRKAPFSSSAAPFSISVSNTAKPSGTEDQASSQSSIFGNKPSLFGANSDASKEYPKENSSSMFSRKENTNGDASKAEAEKTEISGSVAPKLSFGQTGSSTSETSKFSFGKSGDTAAEVPKFSFGNPSTATKDASSFSFGSTEKPKESGTSGVTSTETSKPSFQGLKPAATGGFSFGSGTNPVSLGNQTSSSEPTPVPSFSFSNAQPTQGTTASTPSFSFGQSATADPAQIFGGGSNAPTPSFNFSMGQKPNVSAPQPSAFGATPNAAPSFGFGTNATPAFGGSRPATPSNPTFGFGASNQNGGQVSAPGFGGGINNATAPSSVFGGNSRSATPSFGGFGQAQPAQLNNNQPQPNGFTFSNNAIGGTGFNSAPGSFGQASRESTPPAFGNPMAAVPPGGPNFSGRKIAQMRSRRR